MNKQARKLVLHITIQFGLFGFLYGLILQEPINPSLVNIVNQISLFSELSPETQQLIAAIIFNTFCGALFGFCMGVIDWGSTRLMQKGKKFIGLAFVLGLFSWGLYLVFNLGFNLIVGLLIGQPLVLSWYVWRQEVTNIVIWGFGMAIACYALLLTYWKRNKREKTLTV
jgi:hypothetical protein